MKIVILDAKTLGDIDLDGFKKYGEFISYKTTNKDETLARIKDADIVITNKVLINKEHMNLANNLKLICITATGMNNVDLLEAKRLNIEVKNVKYYSTSSVAEHTFAMLFYLKKKMKDLDNFTNDGLWCKSNTFNQVINFDEIRAKKWGIIGLGTIGLKVASLAQAFGAKLSYYSASNNSYDVEYKKETLKELLSTCDIISIHCPLNEYTDNLLGYEELSFLKDGACIMNLARGGIINEEDLAKIIDEKNIYHATDVLKNEPMEDGHPYLSIKNKHRIFISAHIAWSSKEAREALLDAVLKNIEDFLKIV